MNSLLIAALIVSVIASLLTAYGRVFSTKHEMKKESDNSNISSRVLRTFASLQAA
jgi:hypothetical protein